MKTQSLNNSEKAANSTASKNFTYSTNDLPVNQRMEWLHNVICREYAQNVEIIPPADNTLFNEMTIYPWKNLRLSTIHSSKIRLKRKSHNPSYYNQDTYFAIILLSGKYHLQQNGKDVLLQAGDIAIYDSTLAHQISCSENFSKLIISIPRPILKDRISGVEHCTAIRIPGNAGIGAIATSFINSALMQVNELTANEFSVMSEYALDLLTLSLASVRPENFNLSNSRSLILNRIKSYIENNLDNSDLTPLIVSQNVALSTRYINTLFEAENTSLMRYIWQCRLEKCQNDLLDALHINARISDIAFRWGFNDLSHFSRTFKQRYGHSPKDYRQKMTTKT